MLHGPCRGQGGCEICHLGTDADDGGSGLVWGVKARQLRLGRRGSGCLVSKHGLLLGSLRKKASVYKIMFIKADNRPRRLDVFAHAWGDWNPSYGGIMDGTGESPYAGPRSRISKAEDEQSKLTLNLSQEKVNPAVFFFFVGHPSIE